MATQIIYIQIYPKPNFEEFLPLIYPPGTVGYVSLSNAQFKLLLQISLGFQIPPTTNSPKPLIGVSDYNTEVFPDTMLVWQIFESDPSLPLPPSSDKLEGLSIDLVSVFDTANYSSVFIDTPKPIFGRKNKEWSCTTRPAYSDIDYPNHLSYRVLFSFAHGERYYYFQFDPVILPKPKPTVY